MKKSYLIAALAAANLLGGSVSAQELNKKVSSDKYMRNSVCLMMMEDASVPQKEVLREAFLNAEWSAKYNDHNIGERIIDPALYTLGEGDYASFNMACVPTDQYLELRQTGAEAPKQSYYNETMNQILRELMATQTKTVDTVIRLNVARTANKYLVEQGVAKQLADKWLLDAEGNYTEALLRERGMLNASEDDKDIAAATEVGAHYLLRQIDLEELFGNTFVVVTRFGYKLKDDLVADIMLPMYAAAQFDPTGYAAAGLKAAEMTTKMSMGKGYYVTVDSYLFRLRWNDALLESFYGLWDESGNIDLSKYDASDLFALQFIGNERAWAKTKAGIFSDKDESELIRMAAVDAVDDVLAKFEKKYDEFKTKTPLIVHETTDKKGNAVRTYAARIGTRDGLKGGEVFEVLEKEVYEKDGAERVRYNKKGELTVSKKQVWDNTYSAGQEEAAGLNDKKKGEAPTETLLEGKDKQAYYEGMLLRMKSSKKK